MWLETTVAAQQPLAAGGLWRHDRPRLKRAVSRTRRHEMLANRLPHEIDTDKLAEAALAILSLTLHDDGRVWKGLDWDLMDLLHEKGWIVDPQTKAKSAVLTEDGKRLATEFLRKHFGRGVT
jgi:hypothetical protein